MDSNRAEALRKELGQLLRNKPRCWNHEPSAQQPTPTFWSMRSDKRSFTITYVSLFCHLQVF